jgi:hypothetical protein
MTYDARTRSVDRGNPVQLFRFTYGSLAAEVLAYTSHTEAITVDHGAPVGQITYEPVPVRRDNIVSNGTLDRSAIKIGLDVGTDLGELFRIYPPSSVVSLVIYEGHLDDPDGEFVVIWSGRVVAVARKGSELELSAEPIATQMRRPGLRRHYQLGCPLVLYGKDLGIGTCEASKAAATVQGTVTGISGSIITLASGWQYGFDPAKFIRGHVEWTPPGKSTEYRTILRVSGNQLTLSGIPTDLAVDDVIDVVLGCNHRAFAADGGDCEGLHNALPSYGGHPFIPVVGVINKNPFY